MRKEMPMLFENKLLTWLMICDLVSKGKYTIKTVFDVI